MVSADLIDGLSDRQALWAVDSVGRAVAALKHRGPTVLAREVSTLDGFDANAAPRISGGQVVGGPAAEQRAGTIARFALKAGLEDPREEVRLAVTSAVQEVLEPQVAQEVVVAAMLIGGAVLLGLAVLAKLEITEDGRIVLRPGLPDIEKAGAAVGKLIHAALGG